MKMLGRSDILLAVLAAAILAALPAAALAHEGNFTEEALAIIGAKAACASITEAQLETLGEYYMELMHPGAAHEAMDAMMGGDGSESLRQAHVGMGRAFYCGTPGGMMGGSGAYSNGGGMMGLGYRIGIGMMGPAGYGGGMMGWAGYQSPWYYGLVNALYALLLLGAVILVFLWAIRSWRDMNAGPGSGRGAREEASRRSARRKR